MVRHPTARRVRLAVDPTSGRVRLVLPKRAALKAALAWAETKRDWIEAQQARMPQPRPFLSGNDLPFADTRLTIDWRPGPRRRVERIDDTLSLEGPEETIARRVETWLKREALATLAAETDHYAALAGVTVAKVAIGDAKGRWGSCASSGVIRYSWRLILAPAPVRRATVAHEVAHRVHMNHGAAFHALVETLFGEDPTPARHWLRHHGAALHWVGRSS